MKWTLSSWIMSTSDGNYFLIWSRRTPVATSSLNRIVESCFVLFLVRRKISEKKLCGAMLVKSN